MMQLKWFPIYYLPPIIRGAVEDAQATTQAPLGLVCSAAFAATSLAVQTKYRVRRRNGLSSPCSLILVTIAESGERKTTVENLFFSPIREFQRTLNSRPQNPDGETTEPRSGLRLLYSDVTPQAFLYGLHRNGRSAGLIDDEAGRILSGPMVDDLGLLNKVWNGGDISVDRRSGSFEVLSPRATISWLVQPAIFKKFMDRKGDEARGIGFLARTLTCFPPTTQGTRFIGCEAPSSEKITRFQARITELLTQQQTALIDQNDPEEIELTFSDEAQFAWNNVYNQIEAAIQPGGAFCETRDYASKVAENIARMAGIFHVIEGHPGHEISLLTLNSATGVVLWYADEFVRLFSPNPMEELQRDAQVLDSWLIEFVRRYQTLALDKNLLLQRGPNALRNRDRLGWALDLLRSTGRIEINVIGKRKHVIYLNDAYYGAIVRGQQPWNFPALAP